MACRRPTASPSRTTTRTSSSGCSTLRTKKQTKLAFAGNGDFDDLAWSPDSRFLAYTAPDANTLTRIFLWEAATGRIEPVTSDRYDSVSPAWSRDSKWIYFLSDRNFVSLVGSPWGSRQPEPFYDKQTRIYHVPLVPRRAVAVSASRRAPSGREERRREERRREKGRGEEGRQGRRTTGRRTSRARRTRKASRTTRASRASRWTSRTW